MGLSFAIPIEVAMNVAEQLKTKGHVTRGWLGVLIQDVTAELAESFDMDKPRGALVSRVLPDSPAAKGGFEVGDIILRFNGDDVEHSKDLPPLVGRTPVDTAVPVRVLRQGKIRTLKVVIGELPAEDELRASASKPKSIKQNRIGVTVTELTDAQRKKREIAEGGVLVNEAGGPAARAGIRRGDVIMMLNNKDISGIEQFENLVKDLPTNRSVPVLVHRASSGPVFLALKITDEE
jgi:serine protease Do